MACSRLKLRATNEGSSERPKLFKRHHHLPCSNFELNNNRENTFHVFRLPVVVVIVVVVSYYTRKGALLR